MNDTSQASSAGSIPLGIAAGVGAGIMGIGLWLGFYKLMGVYWMCPFLAGLVVGLAIRFVGRSRERALAIAAIVITAVACWLGYAFNHMWVAVWTNTQTGARMYPGFGDASMVFFRSMDLVLFTAVGCYIAFALSRKPLQA